MGRSRYLSALGTLTFLSYLVSSPAAHAEGSRDLVSSGGNRPYLEYRTDLNANILRRTIIKVYANAGETIDLGSSAIGIGINANIGRINYRSPSNVAGTCSTVAVSGRIPGSIANRSEEVAGPGNGSNGTFVPCRITVPSGQSGIWEIDFVSPNPNNVSGPSSNPPPIAATDNWDQLNNASYISAWDVTVRSSAGTPISGRVYANYYAFNMGGNNRSLSSEFTVLTREGYQYRIDLNGLDPFGFIFFANRNGFYDQASGDPIFRSLQLVGQNPGQLPPGYFFQNPNNADTGIYVTQKTFVNRPDSSMPATANSPTGNTWLYREPVPPPVPTGFGFVGIEGTAGQAGTSPLGGSLTFNSPAQTSYSITIDINQDNIYGNANDRTFVGRAVVGANSVFWDGLDDNGNRVPVSTIPYNVRMNLYAGEAHFPMIDAEQNNSGIIVQRLNQPGGLTSVSENPFNIYYDDRNTSVNNYTVCATGETSFSPADNPGCYGGGPTPRQALTGINSSGGAHRFTSNFGDRRGIDTWVYYPSVDVAIPGGISLKEADLIVDKTVDKATANPGDQLIYTITVRNNGPSDEPGIGFRDTVPETLTNVSWSCAVTSGTGACGAANGAGNTIDTTLDLNNQAVATYTVTGDLSTEASGSITNVATAIRNNDITDPNLSNNTDDAITTIAARPPVGGTICYSVANSNDRLVKVDINTGVENIVGTAAGSPDISAIAYWPLTGILYATNANRLGTLNTNTGAYTNLSSSFGSGNGSAGTKTFSEVDGLTFHPFTGELYGSVRDSGQDLLIKINPATGAPIADAFGPNRTYLVIQADDVGDITFDSETGYLYGIIGNNADTLARINTTDGTVTTIGSLGVTGMEGLTVYNNGSFYGTTSSNSPNGNSFYRISKTTGQATKIRDLTTGRNYESVDCLTGGANEITGTVFLDPDQSGTLNAGDSGTENAAVRLYRDVNGNGQVDSGDILLTLQKTIASGTFGFRFAANGSFVMDVDPATLPPVNSVFTTDNVEVANFGLSLNAVDANNDFGHYTNSNLAIVKRITAINGIRLTDSVDNLTDANDNHPNWPSGKSSAGISTFLAGAVEKFAEPGDVVEYTIYYLATGNFPVTNVKLCDRIPINTTYISNSMVLFTSGNTNNLTDNNFDNDAGEYIGVGDSTAVPCPGTNNNGTILINLARSPDQLPNATAPGTPTNAYGFIRFRVTIN